MNNYVTMEISAGLGNQIFQYAYILALSQRNNINFKLNIFSFENDSFRKYGLDMFDITNDYASKEDLPYYFFRKPSPIKGMLTRLNTKHHWECSSFSDPIKFNKKFLEIKEGYISGAFLSEKYFADQRDKIKGKFLFTKAISNKTKTVEDKIKDLNAVSLHIRRGDYLKYPSIYPLLDKTYYSEAIELIKQKIDNPMFVIFSDDIEYANECFKDLENKIIVDFNRQEDSWQDMYLMSKCKHNITANSSFSRWGAYLNDNKNKIIISPKEYFIKGHRYYNNDIFPDSWIKIG